MRTNEQITNEEGLVWHAWCAKHDVIANDSNNVEVVAKYFQETWQEDVTEANLDIAFPNLKPHLKFYSPLQVKFIELAARIPEQQAKLILTLISSRGLKDADEDRMVNFNTISEYFLDSKLPITVENFDIAVGWIINTGKRPLLWKPRKLQGSEAEAQASREAAAKQPAKTDEVVVPSYVPAHLRDHWIMLNRPAAPEDVATSKPVNADSRFKQLAEDAVASITSHNDRAEAQKLFENIGKWGAELTYKTIINFIQNRKQQRSFAGR